MTEQRTITQYISYITAGLVSVVAVIAFILSYNALRLVAFDNGVPFYLSFLWPLLIDFALVVFSLGVVRAYLYNESTVWTWGLVAVFTLLTIGFNLVHVAGSVVKPFVIYFVFVVPPVALFLSFENLMGMLKSGVKRSEWTNSLEGLAKQVEDKQIQLGNLIRKTEDKQAKLLDIQRDIEVKSKDIEDIGQTKVVFVGIDDPTTFKGQPDKRRPIIRQLVNGGVADEWIVKTLQISPKTLTRDKKALNGDLTN